MTDIKDTHNVPTLQLPNNYTMNEAKTENIPLPVSLIIHANKANIFDGLQGASLISLGQLFEDDCTAILDKN